MSGASRNGWIVATSIGAVEALKDQLGVCRWNYGFRVIQQHAKQSVQSYYQSHVSPHRSCFSSSAAAASDGNEMMRERREKGLRKVMGVSSWGPTTVRF